MSENVNPQTQLSSDPTRTKKAMIEKSNNNDVPHPTRILTFSMDHCPVKIQALSSHTIFDLIKCICEEMTIGCHENETVHCHLWDVNVPGKGEYTSFEGYESEFDQTSSASKARLGDLDLRPNTEMAFTYDQIRYKITFVNYTPIDTNENDAQTGFPRRKPEDSPTGFSQFVPSNTEIDMNTMFSDLNKWAFVEGRGVELNLFQAGRKPHHGYQKRGNRGILQMMYLPVKVGSDLSHYLHCFDHAASVSDPHGDYNWYSLVVLPESNATDKLVDKFGESQPGFCEMIIAPNPASDVVLLNTVFPKVAALAGYAKKKDKKVPKGWISYMNKLLMVCAGKAKAYKSNAPKGTAYGGMHQYDPMGSDDILFQKNVEIKSLHELFCVVEGLLETL